MNKYYIIGTKYGEKNNQDILPFIIEKEVIAIGFCWDLDLSQYYNSDTKNLQKELKNAGHKGSTISQICKFLSIKVGDIIALKSTGSPIGTKARLEIVGYAIVVERNGKVYNHDSQKFPQGLGHTLNVEFLEIGFAKTFELGYGRTIHKLSDKNHISGFIS